MTLIDRIKKWYRPRQFAGVELWQKEEAFFYHLVVLKEEKGEINTLHSHRNLNSLEELVEAIGSTEVPVFLSINVRGVLHKLISKEHNDKRALLQEVLPNAQPGEFILQKQETSSGIWASVIRQEHGQQILKQFAEKELWVTGLMLGPFSMSRLAAFLPTENPIATTLHQVHFDEGGRIAALKKTGTQEPGMEIRLEEERVHSFLLPAFGNAFLGLLDAPDSLTLQEVEQVKREFLHRRLFQTGGWALLLGLLGILLLNTFFYYQYKGQNEKLSSQVFYADTQLDLLDSLKSQVREQENFMQQTSLNQNSKTSYYADQVAASLPSDLQLTELEIFPMQGQSRDYREGQLIRYQKNRIYIRGLCKNSLSYNKWLRTLEEMNWVEKAEHLEYQDLSNRLSTFELQLLIVPPSQ